MRRFEFLLTLLILLGATVPFPARAESEKEILSRLDAAAPAFRSLSANIVRVKYTAILDDRSEESGSMTLLRQNKSTRAKIVIEKPSARALAFQEEQVEVFYPKLNTVQVFDFGKSRGLIDQFLLLGFGGSGKDLAKAYTVKAAGEEKVNGVTTTRLVLTPKTGKVRELLKSVEMWFRAGDAYPVRQKFVESSDDYMEVTYSNVKVNPGLTAAQLQLDLPAGVKREYPQK